MTQILHAYVVSLSWSSGMMSVIPVVSGGNNDGREHAAAMAVVIAMRGDPTPEGGIIGT